MGVWQITFEMSSGGLVSALKGLKSLDGKMLWIGWPGTELATEADQRTATNELRKHACVPVFLSQRMLMLYCII
jgi:trehalose-6-phosphate synthase